MSSSTSSVNLQIDPLPRLIDNERIQLPVPLPPLPPEGRTHRRPNLERRLKSERTSQVLSKGVASKRSAVRRTILHLVHQVALEPLLWLIKTNRINCHEGFPRSHSALPSFHHPCASRAAIIHCSLQATRTREELLSSSHHLCPSRARKTFCVAELFTLPSSHHESLLPFKTLL